MATVSAVFGGYLGLNEPSARFLLALFSAYPIALVYRLIVAECSANIKNLFFTLSGMCVMYYVYGYSIWHSMVDVTAVYLVLWVCGGSLLSVCLTWIITMGHMLSGYVFVYSMKQVHPISWTIPHCVLVLKLIGLSYNIYDSKKDQDKLGEDMKKLAVKRTPSLLEISGFCYFFGSQLVGPQIPFSRHLEFTEGRLFDWNKVSGSVSTGLQRLLLGLFFALLYTFLDHYVPISFLVTDEFGEKSFLTKLVYVVICGKVALWRYICVWCIAEGSCIITGISYGGEEKEGRGSNWQALDNINIIKFETAITLDGVIQSFNLNTNKWVMWYVYKRLKFLGSKQASMAMAMLFVSLWHGVWPGYYINFSLEIVLIMAERKLISFLQDMVGSSLSDMSLPLRLPLTLLAYVMKNCMLLYPTVQFMLLKWTDCYRFMKSLYFYGHVLPLVWLLLYYTLLVRLRRRKQTKTH